MLQENVTSVLRTVPTIVTAHTFCASQILGFPMGVAYQYKDIFARFKSMRRKQNLPNALGISKENWG